MWFKESRALGPSAVVGVIAMVAIEYAANGGRLIPAVAPAADPSFHARLERGHCAGPCPVYSVDIDAAGHVTFLGQTSSVGPSVSCQGLRHGLISAHGVAALQGSVDRSGIFGLPDSYASGAATPVVRVTVTRAGRTKTVSENGRAAVGAPKAMTGLETAIDDAADDRACVAPMKVAGR
jgi:Domain of unknown function (DUF6438)